MAQLIITIPDAIAARVLNDFASDQGYIPYLDGAQPNPETKQAFLKRKIIEHIKKICRNAEGSAASESAANAVDNEIALS